jgi:hypothetical protein
MATACLFIGYDRPIPGCEAEAFGLLEREALPELERAKKDGFCERIEVVGLTPHCGSLNGFFMLFGERAKLDELRRTDGFERLSMRLARLFSGYGVVPGVTLEGLKMVMQRNPELGK